MNFFKKLFPRLCGDYIHSGSMIKKKDAHLYAINQPIESWEGGKKEYVGYANMKQRWYHTPLLFGGATSWEEKYKRPIYREHNNLGTKYRYYIEDGGFKRNIFAKPYEKDGTIVFT